MTRNEYLVEYIMDVLMDSLADLTSDFEVEYNGEDSLMLDDKFESKYELMRKEVERIREKLYEI